MIRHRESSARPWLMWNRKGLECLELGAMPTALRGHVRHLMLTQSRGHGTHKPRNPHDRYKLAALLLHFEIGIDHVIAAFGLTWAGRWAVARWPAPGPALGTLAVHVLSHGVSGLLEL